MGSRKKRRSRQNESEKTRPVAVPPPRALDPLLAPYGILLTSAVVVPALLSSRTIEAGAVKGPALGILALAAFLAWAFVSLYRGRVRLPPLLPSLAVLFYWLAAGLSVFLSDSREFSIHAWWRITVFVMVWLVTANTVNTRGRLMGLLGACVLGALYNAGYAFLQVTGHDPISWNMEFQNRPMGTFGNPNVLSGYLAVAIFLAVAMAAGTRSKELRIGGILAAIFCAAILFVTKSKGGWLAAISGVVVLGCCLLLTQAFHHIVWTRRKVAGAAAGAVLILLVLAAIVPRAADRVRETLTGSVQVRLVYWRGALKMLQDRPLFGTGAGTFHVLFPAYRDPQYQSVYGAGRDIRFAHSEIMQTLAEQGLLGGLALSALVVLHFFHGVLAMRRGGDASEAGLMGGLLAALAAAVTYSAVGIAFRLTSCPLLFWTAAGALAALPHADESRREVRLRLPVFARLAIGALSLCAAVFATERLIVRPFRAKMCLREGIASVHFKRLTQAVPFLERAMRLDPLELRAYQTLAEVCYLQRHFSQSIEALHALRDVAPNHVHLHYRLGATYAAMSKWQETEEEFLIALRQGDLPENVNPLQLLDDLRRQRKWDGERYAAVLKEAHEIFPHDRGLKAALERSEGR